MLNIYGLIATIIVCLTLIIITVMILKQFKSKRTITIEKTTKPVSVIPPAVEKEAQKKIEELEKELNEQSIASASMDSVIKAANAIMGIEVQEDNNEERK